jgi:hypothetical protein
VAATGIGVELGALTPVNAAALVSAGLLSVLLFPPVALGLLRDPGAAVRIPDQMQRVPGLSTSPPETGCTSRRCIEAHAAWATAQDRQATPKPRRRARTHDHAASSAARAKA